MGPKQLISMSTNQGEGKHMGLDNLSPSDGCRGITPQEGQHDGATYARATYVYLARDIVFLYASAAVPRTLCRSRANRHAKSSDRKLILWFKALSGSATVMDRHVAYY